MLILNDNNEYKNYHLSGTLYTISSSGTLMGILNNGSMEAFFLLLCPKLSFLIEIKKKFLVLN